MKIEDIQRVRRRRRLAITKSGMAASFSASPSVQFKGLSPPVITSVRRQLRTLALLLKGDVRGTAPTGEIADVLRSELARTASHARWTQPRITAGNTRVFSAAMNAGASVKQA